MLVSSCILVDHKFIYFIWLYAARLVPGTTLGHLQSIRKSKQCNSKSSEKTEKNNQH